MYFRVYEVQRLISFALHFTCGVILKVVLINSLFVSKCRMKKGPEISGPFSFFKVFYYLPILYRYNYPGLIYPKYLPD